MSTIINATTTNGVVIQPDNSGSLVLQTNNGTTALTIDTSQRAAFVAGTAALPAITTTGDTNTGMFFPAADTIAFAEGGTEAMRLDSSGNVGIGTTSGAAGLTVYKYGSTWTGAGASTYPYPAGNVFLQTGGIASQNNWIGITGNYNTSTGSANILLQANLQDTSNQAGNYIGSEATALGQAALTFGRMIGAATVGGNAAKSEAMRIDSSGGLILVGSTAQKATGTTWSNPSDQRLKDNIRDYTKGTNELMQVRVREWEYNGKGGTTEGMNGLGVIADEVMTILPNTVETYDAKLNADDEETTAIKKFDATEITWLLVKTVQEQQTIINDLKARVETLEAK
jgi:hypothetical protein